MEIAISEDIDESWALWMDLFLLLVDQCIPTKSVKDTNPPYWIDREVAHHIRKKYGALKNYRLYKLETVLLQSTVNYLVRRKHRLYLQKIEGTFSENPQLIGVIIEPSCTTVQNQIR